MPDNYNPWNVESIGHLSARCNVSLWRVRRAMTLLGVTPAMVIDGVDHLRETDAQRVAEALVGAAAIEAEPGTIKARARRR